MDGKDSNFRKKSVQIRTDTSGIFPLSDLKKLRYNEVGFQNNRQKLYKQWEEEEY